MFKKLLMIATLTCLTVGSVTHALAQDRGYDDDRSAVDNSRLAWADVLRVDPVYDNVVNNRPREECYDTDVDRRYDTRGNNAGGTVLGAIVGGALGNQVGKRRIAADARDLEVEQPVGDMPGAAAAVFVDHLRMEGSQTLDVFRGGMATGARSDFWLDHKACLQEIERADKRLLLLHGRRRHSRVCDTQNFDADADLHGYAAFDFQSNQRLAHRRAADSKLFGQFALGRETGTQRIATAVDPGAKQRRDLLVQALGLDRGQAVRSHGVLEEIGKWTCGPGILEIRWRTRLWRPPEVIMIQTLMVQPLDLPRVR